MAKNVLYSFHALNFKRLCYLGCNYQEVDMNRYQQLAEAIKQQIKQKTWRVGEKIPSLRAASKSYSVSSSTVLQAYHLLEAQGWIKAKPQSGYFVCVHSANTVNQRGGLSDCDNYNDKLFDYMKTSGTKGYDLGSPFPHFSLFPFSELNRHMVSAGRKVNFDMIVENQPPGNEALRRIIAQRYLAQGVMICHDDITITSGAMDALNMSLQVTCEPGDTVIVESPSFYGAIQSIKRAGLKVIEVEVCPRQGINLEQLSAAFEQYDVRACWLMVNFHNPTGSVLSDAKKSQLLELANKYDVLIIEDDVYADLYFGSQKPRPIKYWDVEDRVLLCGSFSKSLAPGYRIGWVVNHRFSQKLQKCQFLSTLAVSAPVQEGIADYLKYSSYDNHLRKLRKKFHQNMESFCTNLESQLPDTTVVNRPDGGYFIWVQFPSNVNTEKLYYKLLEQDISVAYGELFAFYKGYESCLRVNVSQVSTDEIPFVVVKIAQFIK